MAKSKRKFLVTALGLAIALSGCSGSGGRLRAGRCRETGDPSLEPVTLEVVIPGQKELIMTRCWPKSTSD